VGELTQERNDAISRMTAPNSAIVSSMICATGLTASMRPAT
jgi:hypothetical protein